MTDDKVTFPSEYKVKPTKLQKRTLQILRENPHLQLGNAMIKGGYSAKSAEKPKQNFTDRRGVQLATEEWRDTLRDKGLGEKKLLEKYGEWIEAKKVVSAKVIVKKDTPTSQANGELPPASTNTDDFIEVPDYNTQLKVGEWLRKDFGFDTGSNNNNVQVNNIIAVKKNEYSI